MVSITLSLDGVCDLVIVKEREMGDGVYNLVIGWCL